MGRADEGDPDAMADRWSIWAAGAAGTVRRMAAKASLAIPAAGLATAFATGIVPGFVSGARAETTPKRIVSINACADQLLLALADPGQIAALSPYAGDARLSFMAAQARRFHIASGSAEETLQMQPDLVLAGVFSKGSTRAILKSQGLRVEELRPVSTIDDGIAQIRHVAAEVGHEDRGEALVGRIEAARAALAGRYAEKPVTALFLQRRGYVTGGRTLIGDILSTAGIGNAAESLGLSFGGQVSLETVLATRPDVLMVASARPGTADQGIALLSHPALAALYPTEKRIVMPERLTVCAGPALAEALERFRTEADRVLGGPPS